ncbi:telomere-associated protein RIF1 [Anoplophora glabripennis]|uniref:telomere-associated protein RIF1 n=1 Tax=Anoplophora glabripennis TaxID=217634 RepID=UPI0008755DB2|nr:telomere-associated protein RIF1 [Anoplophora glabripennis]
MSGNEKCRMYKETQCSIKKLLEKGLKLDRNIYMNQIVLIKKDVTSNDENVRKTAIEMLNFLLCLNNEEIQVELIKIFHEDTVNKFIHNCILKSIKQKVVDCISEKKYNFTNILSSWRNQNTNKLINIIEDVCVNIVPKDRCKIFFINTVIPAMMAINTNNEIRDALIDIAFMMSTVLSIGELSSEERELFLRHVNTEYVINIGELRDKDYPNWHNLWIFLVRFCDKHIHYSMDLTNRLLRVVEFAFRNSSIQQRLKGYDCWKELIDNASLDMNHMCSAKQIKLLITPLKAKFSKQEVVICKRFDVFTYLLEKLQHKAVLCLTEFLEFCFGPVGDNKDASKTGQGKSVPQIWTKSAKVLIEIIGHSHGKTVSCLSTEDIIKLEKPVVNYTNILSFYKIIINSVAECCTLLKEVDIQSKRETVIKCLWKSVFNLIIPTSEANRMRYFQIVVDVLDNYLAQSRENPYFEDLLILIFTVLMSYDEEFVYEVMEYILKQLIRILFTVDDFPLSVVDKFKAVITHWFTKIFMVENKINILKEIMILFTKLKPLKENVSYAAKIWLCLANELVADFSTEQIEQFSDFNSFFMWPAYHLHHLDEVTKKQVVLHWMKLYRKITTDSENKKLHVMKDLQNIFKSNPLLNPDVVSLLNVMSQFETKFSKEFVNNIMIVSSQILQLPNLKTEEEQKITALVMQYFEPSLECYLNDANDELIGNICSCIEHILRIHKGYKLLDSLATFMKNSPNLRLKFSTHLSSLLLDLFNKESDTNSYNAKELQKVLQVLNLENIEKDNLTSTFIPPVGRSARIAQLAKSSPRSPQKRGKNVDPTSLRLFGKDLETLSPLHIKGSQLNNIIPKPRKMINISKTTPRNSPSINDEKSSDFVPIDTEVKFQPEKLSNHQKEVLRKRREDIPALYQDLSQSTSQDMFSSSSSSKGFEKTDQEDPEDKRKVIVEVIQDQFNVDGFPTEKKDENLFQAPTDIIPKLPVQAISDTNVPNVFPDAALSSEIIPEAPIQTIEDLIPNTDLNFEGNLFLDAMLPSEIISGDAIQAINELTVSSNEINADEKLPPQTAEGQHTLDPDETMIHEERVAESGGNKEESNSKELEHKEELDHNKQEEPVDKRPYPLAVVVEGSAKSEAEEKEKRRKQKIEAELQKLRMDIVGAEEFLAASRRTRTREKPKKLDDFPNKMAKKEEKLSPHRYTLRKSLNVEESESATEKNRRKTIGTVQETKSVIEDPSRIIIEDKFNKPKHPDTPKSRGRRLWKCKSEDKAKSNASSKLEDSPETPKNRGKPKKVFGKEEMSENNDKGEKRKHSSGDEESEDIIESSQEFHVFITPFNSSKKKSLIDTSSPEKKLDKSEEKTLVQQKTMIKDDFPEIKQNLNEIFKEEYVAHIEEENKVAEPTTPANVEEVRETIHDVADTKQVKNKLDEAGEVQLEANTSQDTTVTQESTQDITQDESRAEETETQTVTTHDTQTQSTQTQDTLTQSEFSTVSQDIRPPVVYFDLPKKPELTESERIICRMDTRSLCIDPSQTHSGDLLVGEFEIKLELSDHQKLSMEMEDVLESPISKASSSLPSSPVTKETPNRTSELLNNTLDISPINSKCSSDDGEPEDNRVPISINFKADMEELDKIEKEKMLELMLEGNVEKHQDNEEFVNQDRQLVNLNENGEMPVLLGDILTELERIPNQADKGSRQNEPISMKMEEVPYKVERNFDTVAPKDVPDQQNDKIDNTPLQIEETQHQPNEPEDDTCRVEEVCHKKLDMPDIGSTKSAKDSTIQERASRLLNMVNVSSPMTHRLFIKKRSVTMSPSTARIKKLMSNFNQNPSSEEASRDVKEEDLLTFSREVPSPMAVPRSSILKRKMSDGSESDGISPCAKRKRVNFSDPCLTSKKLFIKDEYNRVSEANPVFDEFIQSVTEEEQVHRASGSPDESSSSEKLTETENFETEPSLEMVNPLMLKKDKPIYPKLVDCQENVILILKRVTSPMFITTLMNKLKNKEIKTIGDLAKQSEAEIHRFPFKVPVVPNVYKALDSYYKKNIDKFKREESENGEPPKVNGIEESKRLGVIKKTSPKKLDPKAEFRQLIEKSKTEGTFEELLKMILSSTEKQQILGLVKTQYKLEVEDFLSDSDFKVIIKHIIKKIGLPSTLKMLTSTIEDPGEESVYFTCIMKQSLEKRSLSDVFETRPLDDIKTGLEETISKNVFSRQDVIDQCLLPLIENPSDIFSYLNRISVVQLSDIVVQRLQSTNLTEFFDRILDSYGNEAEVTLRKDILVRVKSPNEIVGIFQDCIGTQNEENQQQIMVEMFKFVSGRLNVNTLLELHVEFLKKLPNLMVSSEK